MRFLSPLFFLFLPSFAIGQLEDTSPKNNKKVGPQTFTIDLGLFLDGNSSWFTPSYGCLVGIEKKRQRLIVGPVFGKSTYSEQGEIPRLTGLIADYSIIFWHPIKQLDFAVFTQFRYNYQERVVNYKPPSQTLILSSRYQESIFGFVGIDARGYIFKNFQFFCKFGAGIESRTTQVYYPYIPANNKYKKKIRPAVFRMIGISYGFPTKKKLSRQ